MRIRNPTGTVNGTASLGTPVSTDDTESADSPMDSVMTDIRREIVRRAVQRDVDDHREIYDALADE